MVRIKYFFDFFDYKFIFLGVRYCKKVYKDVNINWRYYKKKYNCVNGLILIYKIFFVIFW